MGIKYLSDERLDELDEDTVRSSKRTNEPESLLDMFSDFGDGYTGEIDEDCKLFEGLDNE